MSQPQQDEMAQYIKQLPLNERIPAVALYKLLSERENIDN